MTVVKATIVIYEATWNEFKKCVSSTYGNLRKVSLAVEEAIKCLNAAELLKDFSEAMGFLPAYTLQFGRWRKDGLGSEPQLVKR